MATAWRSYKEQVVALSSRLVAAQRPIRVLDALKWDDEVEAAVIGSRFRKPPAIDADWYRQKRPLAFEPAAKIDELAALAGDVAATLGEDDDIGGILHRNAVEYQDVVRMLDARGTREFHRWPKQLYGSPKTYFLDDKTTLRELGLLLYEILAGIQEEALGPVFPPVLDAEQVVEQLNGRFARYFGDDNVVAKLDDGILSDAAAGADYVKVRRGVKFSERQLDLLEVHEGWVHVGTTRNGARQRIATWLSKGPPCTAAIQEGLATIVEVLTFTATPSRAHRLNNRILACDKAEDGANFLEVCEFFRTEGYSELDCYRNAQRVFRGGVVQGGAPFTKDIVYCWGFVMIYNFLRTAIRFGRPEVIPFLFVGKVALDDVPALYRKFREGVVDPPAHLPRHFRDLNGLAMWMAYSNFFNRVDLSKVQDHYRELFAR